MRTGLLYLCQFYFLPRKQALLLFLWKSCWFRVTVESNSNNDSCARVCLRVSARVCRDFITGSVVLLILKQAAVWKSLLKLQLCTETQYIQTEKEWKRDRKSQIDLVPWCGWRNARMPDKIAGVRQNRRGINGIAGS